VWQKYYNEDDNGCCPLCDKIVYRNTSEWHASHIVAKSKGGEFSVKNLIVLCATCNLKSGTKDLTELDAATRQCMEL